MKTINFDEETYHIDNNNFEFLVECLTYRNLYDSLVINDDGFSLKYSLTPAERCRVMKSVLDLIASMVGELVLDIGGEDIENKWNTGIGRSLAQNGVLIDVLMKDSSYEKASVIIKRLLHGVLEFRKYLESTEMQPATGQVGKELK